MNYKVGFFELFQGRPAARLLEFFLENPSREAYAAQLGGLGISRASLFQSLKKLENAGVLNARRVGRSVLYRLAPTPPVKQLKVLRSTSTLWRFLKRFSGKGIEIYLYGSVARGEGTEKSDVDLLAVGKRDAELEREIASGVKNAKITFLTPMEYAALPRKDKAFYESIERDKIRLV